MRRYATQAEFIEAVDSEWRRASPSTEVLEALNRGLAEADSALRDTERAEAGGGLGLRINDWVIRDSDLPVVEAIGVVATAATTAVAPGAIAAAAIVSAVSAFAGLCWKAWRKGARLGPNEVAVLGFLQIHGPLELEALKSKAAKKLKDMSAAEVASAIKSLTDVELIDGDVVQLVRQDASGRWCVRSL